MFCLSTEHQSSPGSLLQSILAALYFAESNSFVVPQNVPPTHSPRFLSRWGSLFEDTRGLAAVSGPDSAPYFPSGSGTPSKNPPAPGADRNDAAGDDVAGHVSPRQRLATKARVSYRAIELARVIAYALLLGGFGKSQHSLGQIVAVLAVAVVQVVLLVLIRVSTLLSLLWLEMFLYSAFCCWLCKFFLLVGYE
jgi:hypothetical protein